MEYCLSIIVNVSQYYFAKKSGGNYEKKNSPHYFNMIHTKNVNFAQSQTGHRSAIVMETNKHGFFKGVCEMDVFINCRKKLRKGS